MDLEASNACLSGPSLFLRFLEARSSASRSASSSSEFGRCRFLFESPCNEPRKDLVKFSSGSLFSLSGCVLWGGGCGKLPGIPFAGLIEPLTWRMLDCPRDDPKSCDASPNLIVLSLRKVNVPGMDGTLVLPPPSPPARMSLYADRSGYGTCPEVIKEEPWPLEPTLLLEAEPGKDLNPKKERFMGVGDCSASGAAAARFVSGVNVTRLATLRGVVNGKGGSSFSVRGGPGVRDPPLTGFGIAVPGERRIDLTF